MRNGLLIFVCLLSLGSRSGMSAGHTAWPATRNNSVGIGIDTINDTGPDSAHNFTIESTDSTVTITSVSHGINLEVPQAIETINSIPPDAGSNFTINAGLNVIITPGTNSISIAAPGAGSGISAISVNRQSIATIRMMPTMNTRMVLAEYITDGPIIMRTALRSLVARDIRSPVRRP